MSIKEEVLCGMPHLQSGGKGKALMAFWSYSSRRKDLECTDSFIIFEPIAFRDTNYFTGKNCQRTFLYRGLNNEVFWFSFDQNQNLNIHALKAGSRR